MSNSTYVPHTKGIKVFAEKNRLDFILEDPNAETVRATIFFNKKDADVKLAGKKLQTVPAEFNEDGTPKYPNRMQIKWGRQLINLGWTIPKNGGQEYFYRSLETANDLARPKTPADIFAAMGWGK